MKKKILFVSVNRHQKKYFRAIGSYLSKEYDIFYLTYNIRAYLDAVFPCSTAEDSLLSEEQLSRIIRFSLKKGKIRQFSGIRAYLSSESTLRRIAQRTFTFIYNYLRTHRIDMVCVWNGSTVERAATIEVAKVYGAKTVFFENGLLPNTTTCDPIGVNAAGLLATKTADFFRTIPLDEEKLSALLSHQLTVRQQKKRWYQRNRSTPIAENIDLEHPYVFVPFQVHDDTQIIINSPYIHNMEELTAWVATAVDAHNQTNPPLHIIIKEHPSDHGRLNYDALRSQYPQIIFVQNISTQKLIENAQAVITVNSTVGIESLMNHKNVITLGNATYAIKELTNSATSPAELTQALSTIGTPPDIDLINRFLYYIRYYYSVEGSWHTPNKSHYRSVSARIHAILNDQFV